MARDTRSAIRIWMVSMLLVASAAMNGCQMLQAAGPLTSGIGGLAGLTRTGSRTGSGNGSRVTLPANPPLPRPRVPPVEVVSSSGDPNADAFAAQLARISPPRGIYNEPDDGLPAGGR